MESPLAQPADSRPAPASPVRASRSDDLRIRISPDLKQDAREAAAAADMSLSEWVRSLIRKAAKRKAR